MRAALVVACVAVLAAPAFADLDFSAVAQRAKQLQDAAEPEHRRKFDAVAFAFGPAAAGALVPPNPYAALVRSLARPDKPGLADDFAKLRSAVAARGYGGVADAPLRAAVDSSLSDGATALDDAATALSGRISALAASAGRTRCSNVLRRGRIWAGDSVAAHDFGRLASCASLARRAAAEFAQGDALVTHILGHHGGDVARWRAPLSGLGGALLSVWAGAGQTPDVYAVGADAKDGTGPEFLRMGAEGWVRVKVGASGTLWWVNGVADQVFAAGTGGRVVDYDPATGNVTDLSVGVDVTLYGVFGAATNDVWTVGGNVDGTDPATALYHFDGAAWTAVTPPSAAVGLTIFKVWGTAADDVWACGEGGLVMHFDGSTWTGAVYPPFESLFTVHGESPTIAVGGAVEPTIVEGGIPGFAPAVVPAGSQTLRGVFEPAEGDAWACGLVGTVLRRTAGRWSRVTGVPPVPGNDFHAVRVDDAGGVWFAGGDIVALDKGVLLYYGTAEPPTAVLPQAKLSRDIAPLFSADHGVFRVWSCSVSGCHVPPVPSGSLNLFVDSHSMWSQLVNVSSTESTLPRVAPGKPSQSYLLHKLDGTMTNVGGSGERMPNGGPYLSQDDMNAVQAWILEGALDN